MKLNPDCIRDILLTVEELSNGINFISSATLIKQLNKYDPVEIMYHVRQMEMSNLIVLPLNSFALDGSYLIKDLTPQGHQFIANIRQENNWSRTKEIASKVGSTSIDVITTIASNVISDIISKQMGLYS